MLKNDIYNIVVKIIKLLLDIILSDNIQITNVNKIFYCGKFSEKSGKTTYHYETFIFFNDKIKDGEEYINGKIDTQSKYEFYFVAKMPVSELKTLIESPEKITYSSFGFSNTNEININEISIEKMKRLFSLK